MLNYGFVRVSSAIPFSKIGDIDYNKEQIIKLIKEAYYKNSMLVVFPELTLTCYTCNDLFLNSKIIYKSMEALLEIADKTSKCNILSIIGLPVINNNKLFNCAAAVNKGKILGIINKSFIPGYREFYEPRWFCGIESEYRDTIKINDNNVAFGNDLLFVNKDLQELIVGVEICEDLWMPVPPSSYQAMAGAVILCNLSASNVLVAKSEYRRELVKNQSSRCFSAYIYTSSGMGESTTDVVFDADSTIVENGELLAESKRFLRENQLIYADIDIEKLVKERLIQKNIKNTYRQFRLIEFEAKEKKYQIIRQIPYNPFVPSDESKLNERCNEIFNIQSAGLAKRFESLPDFKAVIGVSGGLDSTLALLITIKTFNILNKPLKDVIAVTMPGFGTSKKTHGNVIKLCKKFDITFMEKSIIDITKLMFSTINHDPENQDTVYENVQARARTYFLMSIANQKNGIVIGTADLSEIALGWSTYNGDHISMYNVNCSVPKTLVKFLIKWLAENQFEDEIKNILLEIVNQPVSPELIPAKNEEIVQKTEEQIGPYELHDFFLYYFVRFGFALKKILYLAETAFKNKYKRETIIKWLKLFITRFVKNQWKRDCVPAGPKVGSVDLSPRGSWRMPSEYELNSFINDLK
ncbi:MAG: NAD(+) synthase [Spirochaetes bacterium]|nr:NAD(+) synthase [Spirochaetota bacterium]